MFGIPTYSSPSQQSVTHLVNTWHERIRRTSSLLNIGGQVPRQIKEIKLGWESQWDGQKDRQGTWTLKSQYSLIGYSASFLNARRDTLHGTVHPEISFLIFIRKVFDQKSESGTGIIPALHSTIRSKWWVTLSWSC